MSYPQSTHNFHSMTTRSKSVRSLSLEEARECIGLRGYCFQEVISQLAEVADDQGFIDRTDFLRLMSELPTTTISRSEERNALLSGIFTVISSDTPLSIRDQVDFIDLACVLPIMVGGSRESKISGIFELLSLNLDKLDGTSRGYISQTQFTDYLKCLFRVLYLINPNARKQLEVTPDELAVVTAQVACSGSQHRLTYQQLLDWFSTSHLSTSIPSRRTPRYDEVHELDPSPRHGYYLRSR